MPLPKNHKGRNAHEDVRNNNFDAHHHHGHGNGNQNQNNARAGQQNGQEAARLQHCCVPTGCSDEQIDPNDPFDAVKVICNNEACGEGHWMHKDCFQDWEQSVLSFLRSCGRARSWSEKQRLQNLWTKKGYDLAYKACDCRCGRGHLRKDLDYIPPPINDNAKKVRKTKKKNDKPMPVVSTNHKSGHNSNHSHHYPNTNSHVVDNHHLDNHNHNQHHNDNTTTAIKKSHALTITAVVNQRRGSDNSTTSNPSSSPLETSGICTTKSPSDSTTNSISISKVTYGKSRSRCNSTTQNDSGIDTPEILDNSSHHPLSGVFGQSVNSNTGPMSLRLRTNSVSSIGSIGSQGSSCGSLLGSSGSMSPLSLSPTNGNLFFKGKKQELNSEPLPMTIFKRRQDLSVFNALPRYKQNPYHIHIEDLQEDDATRNFVLSNLSNKRMTALRCVLCKDHLPVFDRFPLVDGTLFLSPQAYDQHVVQVIWEGRIQFLNSVCIACLLDGASEAKCVSCTKQWDGSSFVVGTMYTYDIFAAMPCCQKRLTCKHCHRVVVDASVGLTYYSQYSHMIICPFCKANDFHFIRPLNGTFALKDSICNITI